MQLKNMKFRVSSPEQSERLQKCLFGLGYKWHIDVVSFDITNKPFLYARESSQLQFGDRENFYLAHAAVGEDTESFIETYTERTAHNEDNMKAALAKLAAAEKPFKGLEDAYNEPKRCVLEPHQSSWIPARIEHQCSWSVEHSSPWFDNDGTMPDLPEGTKVDVLFLNGEEDYGDVSHWAWHLEDHLYDIIKWRYHKPDEPSEYYVQPKTEPKEPSKESLALFSGISASKEFTAEDAHKAFAGVVRNKYMREIKKDVWVDCYDVIRAFGVTDPCLQHMAKKVLACGQRHHKDTATDLKDILDSAQRAVELHNEWSDK